MGARCCNVRSNADLTIDDQLNYLDQEDLWLRQNIEYQKKKIKNKQEKRYLLLLINSI